MIPRKYCIFAHQRFLYALFALSDSAAKQAMFLQITLGEQTSFVLRETVRDTAQNLMAVVAISQLRS